jgi:NADH:ubiquinone oxidoreductase subunit 4 (subunit M)
MTGRPRARRSGVGTVLFAAILIVVGGYYVLRNTLGMDLPELDSDQVVPIIAVLIGLALLYNAWQDRITGARGPLA